MNNNLPAQAENKNLSADKNKKFSLPELLEKKEIKARFMELLDKNAPTFIQNLLTIYNANQKLKDCNPYSILTAAGIAATVNLSISPSLGHAYIVPFKNTATFQIGVRGLIQLAHRAGCYKNLNSSAVCEGEIRGVDVITGDLIKGEKISDKIVGYVAYMRLVNGFEKAIYMTIEQIQSHAQKYSQSYAYDLHNNGKSSVWSTNFDAMAKKTLLKRLLTHWGVISSSALATALQADSAVVTKEFFNYPDNDGYSEPREDFSQLDNPVVDAPEIPIPDNVDAETGEILVSIEEKKK